MVHDHDVEEFALDNSSANNSKEALNYELFLKSIIEFVKNNKPSKIEIAKRKIVLCREYKLKKIPTDIEILLNADKQDLSFLRKYLETKPMRTSSGVAVIAIMTAPFRCPHGKCTYCPGGPSSYFGDVPQSYTGHEPSTMRGIRNNYDAYLQVMNRLEQYIAIGQNPDKVELIIMGGTFPSYSSEYQELFVRDALQAMNDFSRFYDHKIDGLDDLDIEQFKDFFELPGNVADKQRTVNIQKKLLELKVNNSKDLISIQKENELSKIRCIGMTIETKPDWGLLKHGNEMLKLGCTRVELGVQTLYDDVLKETHRGHTLNETIESIRILKNLGFKLNFHMMPGLPGVTREKDVWCFKELFDNPNYKPDMLKVYPTMVMPGTKLYLDYKKGKFTPLSTDDAADILSEMIRYVPRYCRIMRVQRDIPTKYSFGGVDKNNLRQLVDLKMRTKNYKQEDIRSREIKSEKIKDPVDFEIIEYDASEGKEFFISLKDSQDKLVGFVRLRFPSDILRAEFTEKTAIIRELHVYGKAVAIGEDDGTVQHRGFGRALMERAEAICKENGKTKILVISGIGVREYYRKIGYSLEGPYMSKVLK